MTTKESPSDALVYDYKQDIDAVYKEITSEAYINDRATWNVNDKTSATIKPNASGGVDIVLDRYIHREYPRAIRKLLPATTNMDHQETWEPDGDGWKGSYDVDVKKSPVTVGAEFTLKKKGTGCELRIWHWATAKIPLLGGRVEKYILGQTSGQFGDQLHYLDLRLSGVPDLLPRDVNKYPLPK